jgi:hypothetical protein
MPHYSYVSLFGLNSLEDFKYSIFENTVSSKMVDAKVSLESLNENALATLTLLGRKTTQFILQNPFLKQHVGSLGPVWFLSVRNTLVCVDDIERLGKGLSLADVLGVISTLKEHRGCKVIIILNDEALQEAQKDFSLYFEKVVDIKLVFAPSAEESLSIALGSSNPLDGQIMKCCVTLGISNIRVIKKIERAVKQVAPFLDKCEPEVLAQAVSSIVLLVWSYYEPASAPSLDYLLARNSSASLKVDKDKTSPEETKWSSLLAVYRFSSLDEFDRVLLNSIQTGFVDPDALKPRAAELDSRIKDAKLNGEFRDAWKLFHESFDDNSDQVADALYSALIKNSGGLGAASLNSSVALLKTLGRPENAAEVIRVYVARNAGDARAFSLKDSWQGSRIDDPDLIRAFQAAATACNTGQRNAGELLLDIATSNGWTQETITYLSQLTADDYTRVFKNVKGSELTKIIDACLQFGRIDNASTEMRLISSLAKSALTAIGKESALGS